MPQQDNNPKQKSNFFTGLIAIILLLVIAIIIGKINRGDGTSSDNSQTDTTASESSETQEKIEGTNLTKSAVESECEDAKYGVAKDGRSVIYVWDYEFKTYEYANDVDGNKLMMGIWNGKDSSDNVIQFKCYFSGPDDDNITIHYISAGGVDVWKTHTDLNFDSYWSDGTPEYPDLH